MLSQLVKQLLVQQLLVAVLLAALLQQLQPLALQLRRL
jgi:hypothetical protein